MAKNKTLTIVLLIAVIAIWGLLAFKVYNTIAGTNNIHTPIANAKPRTPQKQMDGFTLHTYDRDPFLSILTDTATLEVIPEKEIKPAPPVVKRPPLLPQYCGIISSGESKRTAILRLGKKHFFLNEGEKYDSMKLVSIKDDKIILKHAGETYTIPVNK